MRWKDNRIKEEMEEEIVCVSSKRLAAVNLSFARHNFQEMLSFRSALIRRTVLSLGNYQLIVKAHSVLRQFQEKERIIPLEEKEQ